MLYWMSVATLIFRTVKTKNKIGNKPLVTEFATRYTEVTVAKVVASYETC
jgi:hypothetical protein